MTTAYIHIGTHKTGSTSIQYFLFKNRNKLKEQGFLYPLSGIPKKNLFGQHHLAAAFLENWQLNTYNPNAGGWEEVISEANNFPDKNIIISSENFCLPRFDLEQIYKVKNYLSQYTVKIVVYLRRQDNYLISQYRQFIGANKYSDSFQQFISEQKWLIDYYKILQPWQQVFGTQNIIVRVFEPERFKNDLLDDFLDTIDYPQNRRELIKTSMQSVSPSIKETNLKQYFNQIAKKRFFLTPEQHQNKYLTKLNNKLKKRFSLGKVINKIPDSILSNQLISMEERIELLQEFEESNQKVAREYLARINGELFSHHQLVN